jgi:hypothetical protein
VAQTTTNSVYSRYGVGEIRKSQFNSNFGLAGAGIALRSPKLANIVNPASLTSLKLIAFEVAVKSDNYKSISNGQELKGNNTFLNHLSLSMPIKEWWGLSFGITPFSSVGYEYSYNEINSSVGNVEYSYLGSGGLNKVFLANGFDVSKGLSVGFTASFIFGGLEKESKIRLLDPFFAFNSSDKNRTSISDVNFDFGVQYTKELSDKFTAVAGLTYSLGTELSGTKTQLIRTYNGTELNANFIDTVKFVDKKKTTIDLPSTIGVGVSLEKNEAWAVELNYMNTFWSSIEPEGQEEFINSQSIIAGVRILPNDNAYSDYLKRITYSFGARLSNSYVKLNNEKVNEYGINFGITLPFNKSISSLTFGMEAMRRGKDSNSLIQEDFLNFNLGITINDRWFIKRKYD